jgi:hypothetical protein
MRKWGYRNYRFWFEDRLLTWGVLLKGIVITAGLGLALIGLAWGGSLLIKRESKIDPFFISIDPTHQIENKQPGPAWRRYRLDDTPLGDRPGDGESGESSCSSDKVTSVNPSLDSADSVEFVLVMGSLLPRDEAESANPLSADGEIAKCGQAETDEQDIFWRNWRD